MMQCLTGPVKRGAAHEQKNGVEDRKWKFQFVHRSNGEWIDGLEGEVSSKKTSKGHAIRDQKSRQAEHPVICVDLMAMLLNLRTVLVWVVLLNRECPAGSRSSGRRLDRLAPIFNERCSPISFQPEVVSW